MKKIKLTFFIGAILMLGNFCSTNAYGQNKVNIEKQTTWTLTYLKASQGQKENLIDFIRKNWFAMDSVAVIQGLFNDYELIENLSEEGKLEWDLIVAVEYYTAGTYSDIAEKFEMIRKSHKTVLVNNLGIKELGSIVKSETVQKRNDIKYNSQCIGKQFEILNPFLGTWEEYIVEDGKEQLFGRLTILLNPEGCSLQKRFLLYNRKSTYLTSGYYDLEENAWIETFTFRNGSYSKYKWVVEGNEVVMERTANSSKSDYRNRNRWTNITANSFDIIEERSYDSGKTWGVYSTTKLKRK